MKNYILIRYSLLCCAYNLLPAFGALMNAWTLLKVQAFIR